LKDAFESGKITLKVKDANGHVSEHKLTDAKFTYDHQQPPPGVYINGVQLSPDEYEVVGKAVVFKNPASMANGDTMTIIGVDDVTNMLMEDGVFKPVKGATVLSDAPVEATTMEKAKMVEDDFLAQLTAEPVQQHKAKPATGKVTTKEHKENGDTMKVEETTMPVKPIQVGLLHNVNVAGSRKFQLENYGGNKYESVELHVSLTIPCTKETIDDAYEFASTWVSDKIEAVEKKLKGAG
jgi:hypothetical protein